ncbi:helix-turn-helix domain-containing protein [Paenibacillus antri]|uniref:Helix-turn-helix domain-containing protein n=1 Tax=Paenibacillus antri TaxID=2582848 RepID=A0A5R9G7S7_9BACL|nr:helix-turn-helix domain-containing protein [Paenibacillus antri]TLS51771.1 helix-turn-helix domain-containing protein [Paenibacillus antri]
MKKWRSNSILFAWLRSYALVLVIPLAMMGIIYVQTQQVIEDEINRANSSLLGQLREEIDSQLEHVQRMREVIAFNARVRSLLYAPERLEPKHRLTMVQAFADFRTYSSTNRYIDNFYIYYRTGNFIVTDTANYAPEMYFQLYLADTGLTYDVWREFLDESHRGEFVNGQDVGVSPGEGDIWFTQSLPIENPNDRLATLVIHMNKERLQAALENIRTYNGGDAYVLDGNRRVLASSVDATEGGPALPPDWEPTEDTGVVRHTGGGEEVVVSYIQSSMLDWTYVYSLPMRLYAEKAGYVRNLTLLTLLIAVVLGALTAVFAARRNYDPIRRLVDSVSLRSKVEPHSARNELQYIGETLEEALERNETMRRELDKQNVVLRSNLIVRLLKGRLERNFPLESALEEYRITFLSDDFAVLLFYIEDFSGLFRAEERDVEKNLRFVHLIMSNIVEELAGRKHRGWVAESDEMLACLVNFAPGTTAAQAKQDVQRLLEEARSFLGERFRIEFTSSFGGVHRTAEAIPTAYREAMEAMEYRMLLGAGTTIDYEQIREPGASYAYPLEKEQQFINHVKSGSFDMAKAIMDEVIERNLQESPMSIDMARCFMFDLVSSMMKASAEAASGKWELLEDNQRALQAMLQEQTVASMRARMTEFLESVCTQVEARKKSRNVRLKDEMLAYIEESYRDPNLSAATLSDTFALHPSYVSRFFKEQTGDTVSDYINRRRMAKAKLLLQGEDAAIKSVSEEVGIYSISTFIRLFKKYEGVTPGAYRDIHKEQNKA